MQDVRWPSASGGRSRVVARGAQVFAVANASDASLDFAGQLAQTLFMLDEHLAYAGASRAGLLSVQIFLADLQDKKQLDAVWRQWVGDDSAAWPQRAVVGAQLDGGLLVEIVAQAFR
ncbi:Enamine deaminase RidA, house cleaning of reactive enamine intermediates, YjgF/YER057c/UK114 family [Polaromonas sp. YR568]|uniref:Rid family hydrolase n=1 Tax=Polaromonas sp. YR568 TaxID=1855301 RepID=UPI0008E38703|nr:Rid family hydrolase [Polaromonas sp. YR568]SFV01667.1 Enamine deaminase RidA, house cleaning of reactive enamine intermediates, YjgF/YER057c/UK114 family [Polaromonas sp. YR568]